MANIVEVQFTIFINIDSHGTPMDECHYGYRIFDDYDADYNNTFQSLADMLEAGLTPEGIFNYINEHHDRFSDDIWTRGVMLNNQYLPPPCEEALS